MDNKEKKLLEEYKKTFWRNIPWGDLSNGINIELIVSSHCNLNCQGCDHFAPIAKEYFLNIDILKQELDILKNTNLPIKNFYLIGGEPLLNPNIEEICILIKDIFEKSQIILFTNGLILSELTENKLQVFNKTKTDFSITKYPIGNYLDNGLKKLEDNGIKYSIQSTREAFAMPIINPEGTESKMQFYTCTKTQPPVLTLKDFKLYFCPFGCCSSEITNLYPQIKIPKIKDIDYLDIREYLDFHKLYNFCMTPKEICRYCGEDTDAYIWRRYDKNSENYLYNIKEYFLYDYNNYLKIINNEEVWKEYLNKENDFQERLDDDFHPKVVKAIRTRFSNSKIDIIIPVYKTKREAIIRLIESLKNQTIIKDCTVYVISDGDEDEEWIFQAFYQSELNCVVLKNIYRKGPGAARNQALKCCYGKYILTIDADDYLLYDKSLEDLYEYAEKYELDALSHYLKVLDDKEEDGIGKGGPCGNLIKGNIIRDNKIYYPETYVFEDGYFWELVFYYAKQRGVFP